MTLKIQWSCVLFVEIIIRRKKDMNLFRISGSFIKDFFLNNKTDKDIHAGIFISFDLCECAFSR